MDRRVWTLFIFLAQLLLVTPIVHAYSFPISPGDNWTEKTHIQPTAEVDGWANCDVPITVTVIDPNSKEIFKRENSKSVHVVFTAAVDGDYRFVFSNPSGGKVLVSWTLKIGKVTPSTTTTPSTSTGGSGVPGFPVESILSGIIVVTILLFSARRARDP